MSAYQGFPTFDEWRPPFDEQTTGAALKAMDVARLEYGASALDKAVMVAARSAAVETGAIEGLYETTRGFTLSIAEEATGWNEKLQRRGTDVERHVHDALAGYEFILDAVTGERPISPHWIRSLHATLCQSQQNYEVLVESLGGLVPKRRPLPKGDYKEHSNNPTRSNDEVFHYCPPEMVASEIDRLTTELAAEEFLSAANVTQSAYAHYAFILIHPFADGNGRVARALASVYLYRSPGVPLVIFSDQRDTYLDALEQADIGNPGALVRFVEARMLDAVQLVSARVRRGNVMDDLAKVMSGDDTKPAQPNLEILHQALRLRLRFELEQEVAGRSWPVGVTVDIGKPEPMMIHPKAEDYNSSQDHLTVRVSCDIDGRTVVAHHSIDVFERFKGSGTPFVVSTPELEGERLETDDVFPRINDVTAARMRAVAGQAVDLAVVAFSDSVRTARAFATTREV